MSQHQLRRTCRAPAFAARRRQHFLRLVFESLEPRYYLAIDTGAITPAPPSVISQDEAIALALNDITATDDGFVLENRRHTATFTPDGLRMTPTAGGPTWHWQISYVGTETTPLSDVEVGIVTPTIDGAMPISYDRGGLTEQYVARADSVEQQFLIPAPLTAAGDSLVVMGTIQSAGQFSATDAGWEWRTDDGVISLGDVTVLDAAGTELAATMQVTANTTRIVIAGQDLAGAVYPVLIDPQVHTNDFRISDMGPGAPDFDASDPAVAYNSTANQYLVVWSGDDSIDNEFEIFGQLVDAATGAEFGQNDFRISDMGVDGATSTGAFEPAVAYNSTSDQYLVVWRGDSVDQDFEIFGQRLSGTAAELGVNDFGISFMGTIGSPNFPASSPAIAYNSFNNEYLVVWEGERNVEPLVDNEREIFGQRVAADGSQPGTADFRISDMGTNGDDDFDAADPAVAYNSTNNEYLVVWSGDDDTAPLVNNEVEIFGQRILGATGAETGTNDFRISDMGTGGLNNFQALDPAVAFNSTNNEYLVVWEGDDDTAPLVDNEVEIFGQRLTAATGTETGTNDFRISDMGTNGSTLFTAADPAVSYNSTNNEYLVVWDGEDNIAPLIDNEIEIFGQRINAATGAALGPNDFRISDMGPNGNTISFASQAAAVYNSTNNQFLVVWRGDDTGATETEIFGQRLDLAGASVGTNDFRFSDMGVEFNFNTLEAAVAFNSTSNEYLVVWSGKNTVDGEFEIYGQRIDALTGAELGVNDFRISDMGPDGVASFEAFQPAVAYNSTNNTYLVVWRGDDDTGPLIDNESEIFGQLLIPDGSETGTNDFRISDMGTDGFTTFIAQNPKVAYNSVNNEFLVVWGGDDNTAPLVDNELEIFGQRINLGGGEVGTNDFRISDMGPNGNTTYAAITPDIAYNPTANEYLVVWRGDDDTAPLVNGENEIFGQRLAGATGAAVGTNDFRISDMGPNGNLNFFANNPAVAYNITLNEFLVVWEGGEGAGATPTDGREIFGQRLSTGGTELGTNDFRISDMGTTDSFSFDAFEPSVGYNSTSQQYLVVWYGDDDTAPLVDQEFEIFGQQLSASGAQIGVNDFTLSDMGPPGNLDTVAQFPAIASSTLDTGTLVVWESFEIGDVFGDGEEEIFGQRFDMDEFVQDKIGVHRGNQFREDANGNGQFDGVLGGDRVFQFGNSSDVGIAGDWNGDGFDEIGVQRGNQYFLDKNGNGTFDGVAGGDLQFTFRNVGDKPLVGDWDGDGDDQIGSWNNGVFYLDFNSNGVFDGAGAGDLAPSFGLSTDKPLAGDWNGDGDDDIGVHRNNNFFLDANGSRVFEGPPGGDQQFTYGLSSDVAVTGDWDLDWSDEIGVKRGNVFLLDANGNGVFNGNAGGDIQTAFGIASDAALIGRWPVNPLPPVTGNDKLGVRRTTTHFLDANGNGELETSAEGDRQITFGINNDVGIAGDWNNDDFDEIGVQRGNQYFLDANGNGVFNGAGGGDFAFTFRNVGDKPLVGDWDGDGDDQIGSWNAGLFYLDFNSNGVFDGTGAGDKRPSFGLATDTPLAGDWNGDGDDDIGVHRGNKFFLDANGNGVFDGVPGGDLDITFGINGDTPITGDWDGDGRDEVGVKRGNSYFLDANGNGAFNGTAGGDLDYVYGLSGDQPMRGQWAPVAPLMAAGGEATSSGDAAPLTTDALAPILQQAIILWAKTGLTSTQVQTLNSVQVVILDLPGAQLGQSLGGTILIDRDAAGYGWFIDPTPADNSEFSAPQSLIPNPQSLDLLSAVLHELGHELSFDHDEDVEAMFETLAAGTRRLLN